MSLFMKDPKKTAMLIIEGMKKAPQTADGAYKDVVPANRDQVARLLEAIKASDSESFMNGLRSFIKDVVNESTDEKPEVPTEEV